jgi:hypothetical protein
MRFVTLVLGLFLIGCQLLSMSNFSTGLAGTVLRGPVTPVCQADVPCDLPFSADFAVMQSTVQVGAFHSDSAGHFRVKLPPGTYRVVPAPNAPIMSPQSQAKEVVVLPDSVTTVQLEFDTGIR